MIVVTLVDFKKKTELVSVRGKIKQKQTHIISNSRLLQQHLQGIC